MEVICIILLHVCLHAHYQHTGQHGILDMLSRPKNEGVVVGGLHGESSSHTYYNYKIGHHCVAQEDPLPIANGSAGIHVGPV